MSTAVGQALEILHRIHGLGAHPLALVIAFALLAALLEQRIARRRTPDFSVAWRDIKGPPPKPPSPPPAKRD